MFAYAAGAPDSPGYAVVTDRFLVLLSADAPAETVRALHRLLDSPAASAEAAIERLSAPEGADRFAVVEIVDPWTQTFHVSVRGDMRVDMGGASTTRFTWPHDDELLTGEADGVETLHLALGEVAGDSPNLPLRHGAVLASAIFLDAVNLSEGAAEPDPQHDTIIAGAEPAVASPASSHPVAAPALATGAAAPAQPAPGPAVPGQAEGATPARASAATDLPRAVDPRPRAVDLASLMATGPAPLWTLTLPDGHELYAAPQIVVGRRPWRSSPDETQTYYVKAPSPHREISNKHVEFTVSGGQLRARDLDSTNGTVVESRDKPPRLLRDGNATRLDVGDVVDLGEGFRIRIGARAGSS
ncbi:FHA domain-containing protein [Demequina sp. NBRC 110053]|uniref:FHA domain-containing protein n=1 Tax=Demequina sp. NBRC 110053 TaxID=1570342 RepID=UPI000A041A4F|nr:FHA domain-containing protein [Demequina sp. NBRC 110053]